MGGLATMIAKMLGSASQFAGMATPMVGGGSQGAMPTAAPIGKSPSMGTMLGSMGSSGGGGGAAAKQMAMMYGNSANKDMSETPNAQALFSLFTQLAQQQPNWQRQYAQPNEYVEYLLNRGL